MQTNSGRFHQDAYFTRHQQQAPGTLGELNQADLLPLLIQHSGRGKTDQQLQSNINATLLQQIRKRQTKLQPHLHHSHLPSKLQPKQKGGNSPASTTYKLNPTIKGFSQL
ncbi:hypothetical protein Nepgr_018732 [Nepenthes gracilis]|uniref:Uncharacterized protein n=1 Tax=Nepenthes gracilis TaxID=150966 RepID=A0AAD3XUL7_NEPGR|nr:hypothetical protein Nepgr_018732 [Nepenthes gracilis]